MVKPDQVATFRCRRAINGSENRNIPILEGRRERGPFATSRNFTCLEYDGATVCDDDRIVSVKRVEAGAIVDGQIKDLRTCVFHQVHELLVMTRRRVEIRCAGVAEILPLFFNVISATEGLVRAASR
jgi:hypothetical protein